MLPRREREREKERERERAREREREIERERRESETLGEGEKRQGRESRGGMTCYQRSRRCYPGICRGEVTRVKGKTREEVEGVEGLP